MAYNMGAIRRAMRRNPHGSETMAAMRAARAMDVGRSTKSARRRRTSGGASVRRGASGGLAVSLAPPKRRRRRKTKSGTKRKSTRRAARRTRRSARRAGRRRSSRRRRSRKGKARRRSSRRKSRRKSRRSARPRSRRGRQRRVTIRKSARRRSSKGRSSKGRRRSRRASRRASGGYYFGTSRVRVGRRTSKLALRSLQQGYMPAGYRVGRMFNRPTILQLSRGMGTARRYRRLSRKGRVSAHMRRVARLGHRRRRASARRASRRKSRKGSRRRKSARRASRRSARRRSRRKSTRVAARRRRRTTRRGRNSRRRRSRRVTALAANRRRRTRRNPHYVLMNRRRRSRRRVTRNMLVSSGMSVRSGKGTMGRKTGRGTGRRYQVVELGPRSKRRGYPVYIPAQISARAYLRRYTFGGAAKRAHARRRSIRKNSRRHSMRRRHSRRRSTRRNPHYVVMKNRRRRLRRNLTIYGTNVVSDVAVPVLGGTAGFVAARVLANGVAGISQVRGLLDSGAADAATADNTKLLANALGIVATLGLATKVPLIRQNQGAIVTGMGLALADRIIRKVMPGQSVLSGFGEYVNQPMGEYVNQPLGAYVNDPSGFGEYVNQPVSGLGETYYAAAGYPEGTDPANQESCDGLMDVMEAAAGVGETYYAAAGMGETYYAAAGLGADAAPPVGTKPGDQPPFVSIQTPTDIAKGVTKNMPYDKPVPTSLVTPEGRGWAGGLFARHLFAGMLSG